MPSCQFSLYPLGTDDLSPAIEAALKELDEMGLSYEVGSMSTLVYGSAGEIFSALEKMYKAVSSRPVVMTVTVSNACPVPKNKA